MAISKQPEDEVIELAQERCSRTGKKSGLVEVLLQGASIFNGISRRVYRQSRLKAN
jgi:hypothetical protein